MKPITHPLAIAYVNAFTAWEADSPNPGRAQACIAALEAWRRAGAPPYADPTPLPAPALGMRVWRERECRAGDGSVCRIELVKAEDVDTIFPHQPNRRFHDPKSIVLITNYCTGEVIWRHQ